MKKITCPLLSLLLLVPAFSGCASTARSAARAPLNPSVDRMLDDVARSPSDSKVGGAIRDGIKAIRKGRYAEAGKSLAAGLRIDPANGNLHFLNALAYHLSSLSGDQAMLDLAESGYATALRFDPDNYWAAYFLGHVYFTQKRYKDAQNQFSYALLYAPEDAEFLRALATASYYEQSLQTAGWAAEKAAAKDPANLSGWRLVTLTRAAKGDFKGAEEGFLKYQALTGPKADKKDSGAVQEWTTAYLRNRIEDWKAFHRQHPALVRAAGPGVFKAPVQAEGKPLDVAGQEENFDDSNDASAQNIPPGPAPAPFSTATKLDDAEPKMTLVDVVLLSTEESRSQSKGVNLLAGLKATLTGTLFAYKYVNGHGSGGASGRSTTVSPTFALESMTYNLNIWNDGVNKAEVLARPSLLAVENQTSQFYSGAVLHVQLNSNNSDGSMVDVPVGINLSVTPTFIDNETVKIKVHADRSFIESKSEKLGFDSFSQTSKTSVDATAIMKFGETLILSGLSENETTKAKSGVPFLQSIPVIQWFFSNKTEQEMKKSVMILICPQKAHRAAEHMTPAEAKEMRKALRKGPEAVAHLKALKAKEGLDTKDNLDAVYEELYKGKYYKEFQSGDLRLDEWHNSDSMVGSIKRVLGFLWY